ncbi:MAG TPA: hypothetical protein DF613_05720 [Lachnospiraceae bacterium]|nr:hypothetical protein [Lachnospiraceae bacterium]
MKIVSRILDINNALSTFAGFDWHQALFFDIETTGLNHRCSHLYLIGAMWLSEDTFCLRQWFAEKPGDEDAVLQDFLQLISGFAYLIHYNGSSFDIPYLVRKCAFYGLDPSPFHIESCDLYTRFRPLKPWLDVENMKLKTVERAVGLHRKDRYTGKELIELYKKWLQTGEPELLECLFLHNHEDLTGMIQIQRLFSFLALQNGILPLALERCEDEPDSLTLRLIPAETLPLSLAVEKEHICLSVGNGRISLRLPKRHDELRLYFPDYRNYYYLPREDRALHKSVAVYTDPAYRQKATPDTCYERRTGTFLPQWKDSFTPVFRENRGDKTGYFLYDHTLLDDINHLSIYAAQIIQHALS